MIYSHCTHKGPFTQRASEDAAMHAFLDAMKRRDRVFHTVRDKTVISTLSDLYMCSQVINMSYAVDNYRDGFSACSNAPVSIHH